MNERMPAIEAVLENFPIPAWMLGGAGEVLYMNDAMAELFGDLVGERAAILYGGAVAMDGGLSALPADAPYTDVVLADVPFRLMAKDVDLTDGARYRVEFFEDVSENMMLQGHLTEELARIRRETDVARSIQRGNLPADGTYWDTIAFSSVYLPADELGGDFFDILRVGDDAFLVYIADVSGHGIQASLLTMFMQERIRTRAGLALSGVDKLLSALVGDFCGLDVDSALYITMALCLYNRKDHTLSIANAGHNCAPLIIRDSGRSETVQVKGLPISAISDEEDYVEEVVGMDAGDRLVLFTDGVVEEVDAATRQQFGPDGVRDAAERMRDLDGRYVAHHIIDEAGKYQLLKARDDRTIAIADILL